MNSLKKVGGIVRKHQSLKRKVGLITGGFDIIHLGHIDLINFAKRYIDFLVIGVEPDQTLTKSKGLNRPVNSLPERCQLLNELRQVDLVFPITFTHKYRHSSGIDEKYKEIYKKIRPDYLITNKVRDKYWEEKERGARELGIKFLGQKSVKTNISTSLTINNLVTKNENIQKQVENWVSQYKEGYFKPLEILARLIEETGELARELNHRFGPKRKKPEEKTGEIGDEIADIIFTLTCLANSLKIDMDSHFKRVMNRYNKRDKDRWKKKIKDQ